jgi:cysteine-rich repeat protein
VQYSILFYKRTVAYQDMVELFDVGYANFTFNGTLINLFINSIDTRYTTAPGRMFFGLREFNFTYLNNKKFQLNVNSYSNLLAGYVFSDDTLVRIRLSYYFFVKRTCTPSTYFYKNPSNSAADNCFASCAAFGDRPVASAATTLCMSCHYSCLTCSALAASNCLTCSSASHRAISGTTCPCTSGYLDAGAALCVECSSAMVGCLTCSSSTACTSCRSGFTGTTSCTCSTNSVVSGFCNTVYGCTSISDITGAPLCTACNEALYLQLSAGFQCVCITGTTTLANLSCSINCGDKYVLPQEGCDDGNTVSGDGCSSTCAVEKNWACTGSGSAGSTCKISTVVNL